MRCRCVLARFHLVGPTFSCLLIPPLRITKKGYLSVTFFYYWSGQWDSDPRHQPWQGCALPLSYTRIICEQVI